jgi:hypothetical protein
MEQIFEWMSRGHFGDRVPRGRGIQYTPGVFIGTGGARYKMAPSNWFISKRKRPVNPYGLSDMLQHQPGPYEQGFTGFEPAEGFLAVMYDMLVRGIDPNTGDSLPPYGTPGTLKFGAGLYGALDRELNDADPGAYNYGFFGGEGTLPIEYSGYSGKPPGFNEPRPEWIQAPSGQPWDPHGLREWAPKDNPLTWDATKPSRWNIFKAIQDYTGVNPPPMVGPGNTINIPLLGGYE